MTRATRRYHQVCYRRTDRHAERARVSQEKRTAMANRGMRGGRWWDALLLLELLALTALGADDVVCTCERKGACYHYLRAPVRPPPRPTIGIA